VVEVLKYRWLSFRQLHEIPLFLLLLLRARAFEGPGTLNQEAPADLGNPLALAEFDLDRLRGSGPPDEKSSGNNRSMCSRMRPYELKSKRSDWKGWPPDMENPYACADDLDLNEP
jgi:hypothetical protein